ncbi:MAG: flagellar biosynthesis protein FlhA [Rickettsiales bacterium]|nr:flagellar biosynthesis protein FlhA [Pseudomonadota bacterium]MDA0967125.1 flagellar biosynthesis protein FlhA [Pseudomonadota bacterium]MDG4542389.1 flagellar biosynthesis protein FlhA [Rickettsiales bacterium]MDG4544893.1 flagellar biosynthesis protein FlhA [Rickettsiales bacterium]MDG4547016.1 flagellar biosynthesis protein FlhA [Rickettsiales bacterium]
MAEDVAAKQVSSLPFGMDKIMRHTDIMFALGIIGILVVLLVPVPTFMLDLLLGVSITFGVMILMTVLFIDKALDFSSFPTILLVAAMFRLSLNIASTRLILANGHEGPSSAGHVIEAFGGFVMAGSVVIGAIVFGILTIINFIVITKGSGRIAEVAARFSLDAMPGKQMAIDADLSAGLINEDEAKRRRKELEDESTFFGAMDGASKFVRGDAIAGLLITFINLIGGMIIGIVQRDLSFSQAIESYTILTIGDGLVSQIPALIVSTSAGLLVSKSGVRGSTDKAIFKQLGTHPQALGLVSFIMALMAFMPAIPAVPFLFISASVGGIAWNVYAKGKQNEEVKKEESKQEKAKEQQKAVEEEPIANVLQLENIKLELGYGLLPLINYEKGNKLPDQIKALRKQMAKDMGFVMPSVRIQDNMQLQNHEYVIRIKDIECGRGMVRPDMLLVMDPRGQKINIPGEETKEPTFGLPAKWVGESSREDALFRNYTVVDPPTVITTHLTEIAKDNINELLSYSETQKLLDGLGEEHKKLVDETVPEKMSVGGVQRVLQNLLSERVSIRDLPTILEAISEVSASTKSVTLITEYVRGRLSRQISFDNVNDDNVIELLALSSLWEKMFTEGLGEGEDRQLSIPPSKLQEFITNVKRAFNQHEMRGESPVLLVNPSIRPYVRSVVERFRPSTVVLSQNEIHPKVKIKTLGQI